MRWPWQRWLRRAKDGAEAEAARAEAEEKLRAARKQGEELRAAAPDLAWVIEQSMRRPR
jgi:F0F1-type ATP synthase membrane subunit b/b'